MGDVKGSTRLTPKLGVVLNGQSTAMGNYFLRPVVCECAIQRHSLEFGDRVNRSTSRGLDLFRAKDIRLHPCGDRYAKVGCPK
jgi:hypothetical protein